MPFISSIIGYAELSYLYVFMLENTLPINCISPFNGTSGVKYAFISSAGWLYQTAALYHHLYRPHLFNRYCTGQPRVVYK